MHQDSETTSVSMSRLLAENPALLISLAYLTTSLLGIFFSYSLFRNFDVNFFDFADIGDFLLAAVREPMTFLLAGSALVVTGLMRLLGRWEQRWLGRHSTDRGIMKGYAWLSRTLYRNIWAEMAIFVLYSFLFIALYGDWKFAQIKQGRGNHVLVELHGDDEPSGEALQRMLLGGTNQFLFFYDPVTETVEAVPHESIARVTVPGKPAERGSGKAPTTQPAEKETIT